MALWTDLITPAEATGYLRASMEDAEARKGSLAEFLPNDLKNDTVLRLRVDEHGLVDEARFRAYDAEPAIGRTRRGRSMTMEMPALSQTLIVTELEQLRALGASEDAMRTEIEKRIRQAGQAIAARMVRMRGQVLETGKAVIDQDDYQATADFGRAAELNLTAPTLWSDPSADRLGFLEAIHDAYVDANGEEPGSLLLTTAALRALARGTQVATVLPGGATRPARTSEAITLIQDAGFENVVINDRRTSGGRVISDNVVIALPAPVSPDSPEESALGATFWGRTLTAQESEYQLPVADMPGAVCGVYRNEKPPHGKEVFADAIGMPALANANLSVKGVINS